MNELDNLILHTLRQIGCSVDDELNSMVQISAELLVPIVSQCLSLIDPAADLPSLLPPNMPQRVAVANLLTQECKASGYLADIGYHTFLYPNAVEVRRLLMFLIEKIPKSADKIPEHSSNNFEMLEKGIRKAIKDQLSAPWIPAHVSYCTSMMNPNLSSCSTEHGQKNGLLSILNTNGLYSKEHEDYYCRILNEKLRSTDLSTEFLSLHIAKPDCPEKVDELTLVTSEESKKPKTDTLKHMADEVSALEQSLVRLSDELKESIAERKHLESGLEDRRSSISMLEKQKESKNQIAIVLKNPETNINTLKTLVTNAIEKRKRMENKWADHRAALDEDLRQAKDNFDVNSPSNQLRKCFEQSVHKVKKILNDLEAKTVTQKRLAAEVGKININQNRSIYTTRILESVNNIKKQNQDIVKVLQETRQLQKEINNVTGQLGRQFTVTDDFIYASAKRDETFRNIYKLVVALHLDCENLLGLVQKIGTIMRDIRDLEDQIDTENGRNVSLNLHKIELDLKEIEQEKIKLEGALEIKNNS